MISNYTISLLQWTMLLALNIVDISKYSLVDVFYWFWSTIQGVTNSQVCFKF